MRWWLRRLQISNSDVLLSTHSINGSAESHRIMIDVDAMRIARAVGRYAIVGDLRNVVRFLVDMGRTGLIEDVVSQVLTRAILNSIRRRIETALI